MPTLKQRQFTNNLLDNVRSGKPQSLRKILVKSGYKDSIAKQPSRIVKSVGVIKLLKRHGITFDKIAGAYKELMNLKLNESSISIDQKRKLLRDLSEIIIPVKTAEITNKIEFIKQFKIDSE